MNVDPTIVNKWKEVDNDDQHYNEFEEIISYCFEQMNSLPQEMPLEQKKMECAKLCGAFFYNDNLDGKNTTKAFTANQYESLPVEIKDKCKPVIPGDTIWCDKAFSEYGQHFAIYLGRQNPKKYGYVVEVDAILELGSKTTGQTLSTVLTILFSTTKSIIRCYKNLYEFTFLKALSQFDKEDRRKGNFGVDNSDEDLDYGSFFHKKSGTTKKADDSRNNCGVIFTGSKDKATINPMFIQTILNKAITILKRKNWDYNALNSNCESFSQEVTSGNFVSQQQLSTRADICLTGLKVIAVGAVTTTMAPGAALFFGTCYLYSAASQCYNYHKGGSKDDLYILPEIYYVLKMIDDNEIDNIHKYLTNDKPDINKVRTENVYKSLILSIIVTDHSCSPSDKNDPSLKLNIAKLLVKIHKKIGNIESEVGDNTLLKNILLKIDELNINTEGVFLNEDDIQSGSQNNTNLNNLIDFINTSVTEENKTDLDFNPDAGDLSIVYNGNEMPIENAQNFEELSDTFIGKLLEMQGGKRRRKKQGSTKKRKHRHRYTKKYSRKNKKSKKYNKHLKKYTKRK